MTTGNTKERFNLKNTKMLTFSALLTAIAILLNFFPEIPMPLPFATWLKLDFSFVPILMLSLIFGPVPGVISLVLTNFIHMLSSNSFGVGQLANIAIGLCFILPPSILYKIKKDNKFLIIGGATGVALMAIVGVVLNRYLLVPVLMGDKIATFPMTDYLIQAIVPFNIIKGSLNFVICLILYKKLIKELHRLY